MVMKFTNNATSTLASTINSSATSLSVATGTGSLFPTLTAGDYFYCTLANLAGAIEIVQVTARSTDTFTIVRGQDGTTGLGWTAGDKVELRLVAASLNDLPKLDEPNVFTAANTLGNSLLTGIRETSTIAATPATGTVNFDISTQAVLYYTTNASGNFTVNFRGNVSTTLNSIMSTGQSLSVTFLVTCGSTAYYNSAVQVDGSSVTPKWQGGTAPTSGNASSIDSYTYVIIKTGSAAFTVLASQTKFA